MPALSTSPVLILGAGSDLGAALAHAYAAAGRPLVLVARDAGRLSALAEGLGRAHGVAVRLESLDVLSLADHGALLDRLGDPPPGTVVSVVGWYGPQEQAVTDPDLARRIIDTNFTGPALLLQAAGQRLAAAGGGGCLIGIGSVVGDRPRAGNHIYGAAKAGFAAFLSGLRQRLHGSGVRVLTVKPGYISTRAMAGRTPPRWATATPDEVARAVLRAERRGREVLYVRPVWIWITLAARLLPEGVFKRLPWRPVPPPAPPG